MRLEQMKEKLVTEIQTLDKQYTFQLRQLISIEHYDDYEKNCHRRKTLNELYLRQREPLIQRLYELVAAEEEGDFIILNPIEKKHTEIVHKLLSIQKSESAIAERNSP